MNITVIQPDIIWEDKSRNFEHLSVLISPLSDRTDLIILPEMFNTGFSMSVEQFSELPDGDTFNWMRAAAKNGNFGVCGSYMVKSNGQFFNRWVFVSPENRSIYYDKRHLFSMGEEDKNFSKGHSRIIFNFRGMRICPFICYDLRFPVWSRNRDEYDLAIYSANWPEARINVWNTLIKARAIENQCYVTGANRIGTDGMGISYCGESAIINPRGEIIESAANEECVISADLSMSELKDFRSKFSVLNDADDFSIVS